MPSKEARNFGHAVFTEMDLLDEAARRRAVTFALRVTAGTPLEPDTIERSLLEAYVQGHISFTQLEDLLEQRAGTKVLGGLGK